jgi:hypothetical protein
MALLHDVKDAKKPLEDALASGNTEQVRKKYYVLVD